MKLCQSTAFNILSFWNEKQIKRRKRIFLSTRTKVCTLNRLNKDECMVYGNYFGKYEGFFFCMNWPAACIKYVVVLAFCDLVLFI